MKYIIASDIHGSALYLKKLLERFYEEKPEKMILLGDILYHGPRNDLPEGYNPKEVISLLNPLKENLLCVRGNCDCEVDQMVLDFPILADYAYLDINGLSFFATHGHLFGADNPPPLKKGEILLHGHTHIPEFKKLPCGNYYINPGSVSIPKESSENGYILLDGKSFIFKNLDNKIIKISEII